MLHASTRALLEGVLDYAGTFPPAGLAVADAVRTYVGARSGDMGWMLGRLVLPVASLREFEPLAATLLPGRQSYTLSVVLGAEPADTLEEALAFNQRAKTPAPIVSLEFPPVGTSDVQQLMRRTPTAVEVFFEVPLGDDTGARIEAIARAGASAKVRTGGVTPGTVPSPYELARFLRNCAESGVAFKATAGLHHAVRGRYPLTGDPDGPVELMYGFLNLCAAAALLRSKVDTAEVVEALGESDAGAFVFRPDGLKWRDRVIDVERLVDTRRRCFRSFGSCSFREPIDELAALHLL